jgi:hypothetical protein
MVEGMERPRRKRLSWESRCEVVAAIEAGLRPAALLRLAVVVGRPRIACGGGIGWAGGRRFARSTDRAPTGLSSRP